MDALTSLSFCFDGCTLTAQPYQDEILDTQKRLYAGAVGNGFILMDDNARPPTANTVQEFFQREGITRLDWPARSPDLTPIEQMWNEFQVHISARHF